MTSVSLLRARAVRPLRGRALANPKVVFGCVLLGLIVLATAAHPLLLRTVWSGQPAVYHPITGFDPALSHPAGPSVSHPFGTDALGRDVLSLLLFALRSSLLVALVAAPTIAVLALLSGSLAAYYRGAVDSVLSHFGEALSLFPPAVALIIVGLGRPDFGPMTIALIYGVLFGLGPAATVVRSRALVVMTKPFVDAATVAGGGARRIIGAHLVPDLLPLTASQTMSGVTGALIAQALVEFLSAAGGKLGLGSLVYLGLVYRGLVTGAVPWTQLLAGALTISFLTASFYMISVGLRESSDPRVKY